MNMLRTFVVEYTDGSERRIKAGSFRSCQINGIHWVEFFRGSEPKGAEDSRLDGTYVANIIAEDMLVSSFEETIIPDVVETGNEPTDYLTDTLFSEADRVPFSPQERQAIPAALKRASERIRTEFATTPEQQSDIEQKLDYLSRKIRDLDKFNWKRLLITTLVGISVDLGFGTYVPAALLAIFKDVLTQLLVRLADRKKSLL